MKIKAFFMLLAIVGFTQEAPAQTSEQNKARALYFAAEDAYASEDYESALIALNEAVSLLGTSNAMISSLRIKTLFKLEQYDLAEEALDRFFSYEASDELIREMSQYLISIKKAKTRAEQEQLTRERDQEAFAEAARLNTAQAYSDYLEQFGADGNHVIEATIREEEAAWAEAVQQDTQQAYKYYLERFEEDGRHAQEAKSRLHKLIELRLAQDEQEAWARATENDDWRLYEQYLESYPNGRYAAEAKARRRQALCSTTKKCFTELTNGYLRHDITGEIWTQNDKGGNMDTYDAEEYCRFKVNGKHMRLVTEHNLRTIIGHFETTSCGYSTCNISPKFNLNGEWYFISESYGVGGENLFNIATLEKKKIRWGKNLTDVRVLCTTDW